MDLLKSILYTLARFGIMLVLIILGCFAGEIVFPSAATILPKGVKGFMTNDITGSLIGMMIMIVMLMIIFYSDGKRHTAYEEWSGYSICAIQIIIGICYLIPGVFRDSFAQEGRAQLFYKVWYYPCEWLYNGNGVDFTVSILTVTAITVVLSCVMYILAYHMYLKNHPGISENFKTE